MLGGRPWLDGVAVGILAALSGLLAVVGNGRGVALTAAMVPQGLLFVAWGWASWRLARRRKDWERKAWLLFAACVPLALVGALVAWALGADLSSQSPADPATSVMVFALYGVLFAGLLALNIGQARSADGWRRGLDAAIIAGALFFILWSALYRDQFEASALPASGRIGLLVAPALDAALVTLAVLALAVPDRTRPRGYGYLLAGLAVVLAGDVVGTALHLTGNAWADPLAASTGVASLALLALSAVAVGRQPPWVPAGRPEERLWVHLIPLGALSLALGSAAVTVLEHGELSLLQFWAAFGVIALVLGQLALTMHRARRLERRLRAESDFKTQLLRFISHEVANPLSPLRVQVAVLGKDRPVEQERSWAIVTRSLDRLLALSNDVREMALAETQRLVTAVEVTDAGAQVAAAAAAAAAVARQRGLELVVEASLEQIPVRSDRQRFGQVIDNLLSNAIKFTHAPGKVTVRVERRASEAWVGVTDTGIGLSPADRDGLFQPFRRAQDAAAPGLGLGLYLCKAIMAELHGRIGVESPGRGQGATFWVALPVEGMDPDPLPLGGKRLPDLVAGPAPTATLKLA